MQAIFCILAEHPEYFKAMNWVRKFFGINDPTLGEASREELIEELFTRYKVRPINKKLEEALREVGKHLRTESQGNVPNDCSSMQNITTYLIKIGVINKDYYLDFTKYKITDFESDN